jgi:hypothetical protein
MPSRLNNRNYNRQHRIRGQPREPSPAPLPDPPLTGPDGPEESADDPELNWYYGQDAGGFKVTFGKHRGKDLNELPYSYLKWCSSNLLDAVSIHPRRDIGINLIILSSSVHSGARSRNTAKV